MKTLSESMKFNDNGVLLEIAQKLVRLQYQIEAAMRISKFTGVDASLYMSTARAVTMSYHNKNLAHAEMLSGDLLMLLWEFCENNIDVTSDDRIRSNIDDLVIVLSANYGKSIAQIKYNMKYKSKTLDDDFARILSENMQELF